MSAALFESISRIARHEASARAIAAVGRVVEIHPAGGALPDHAATVELRDSGLLLPRVPIAVGVLGFAAIPAVDDLIVVLFLEGDYNAPVVVGRLYHPDQDPPTHGDGEIVLALPSGQAEPDLKLKVTGTPAAITLELPGEVKIEIAERAAKIAVGTLHVDVSGAGGGRVEVAAGSATITLKQDGDVSISSPSKLKLEATEIELAGSAKVKVTGAQVEVN